VPGDPAPNHEEGGLDVVLPQRVEDRRRGARVWAVVEGKRDPTFGGSGSAVGGQVGPGILGYHRGPEPPLQSAVALLAGLARSRPLQPRRTADAPVRRTRRRRRASRTRGVAGRTKAS
jgi:hypothetical protein